MTVLNANMLYVKGIETGRASLSVALIKPGQLHEKNLSAGPISGACGAVVMS